MKKYLMAAVVCLAVMGLAGVSFAQQSTPAIPVRAQILSQTGLTVSISQVIANVWNTATSIDFGTLTFDTSSQIFRASGYYVIDVGINSNAANWTITHTANSVASGGNNLDGNINVTFVRQLTSSTEASLLNGRVSYAASNAKSYAKSDFPTGWLRIYYGIASGSQDNTGVSVITTAKPAGTYQGSVVLTLTTQ